MKQLYIIGNGFDIHHNIPSRYSNYQEWLKENDEDLFDRLRNYYNVDDKKWWNQFEKELGYPDMADYIDELAFENQPNYGSDDFRDRDYYTGQFAAEIELGSLFDSIKETFAEWVTTLPAPQGCKKIRMDKNDAFFINFNYTNTLQTLYNINSDKILFIHGNSATGKDLVLGHNRPYEELNNEFTPNLPNPPKELKVNELEDWFNENSDYGEDFIHQSVREEVISQVCKLRKDTQSIINVNQKYFETLKDVQTIYIYGFSFSPIDLPYLSKIVSELDIKTTKWIVSYYSEEDIEKAHIFFEESNISVSQISFIKLNDLLLVKQLELRFDK